MTARTNILLKIVLLWGCLSMLPLGYYLHTTHQAHGFLIERLSDEGHQFLNYADEKAAQLHDRLRDVFRALSHSPLLLDFAITHNPKYKHYLQNQWQITSKNIKYFYQLRYLDAQGHESIRVDFPESRTQPFIVPDTQLQDKSHRDYFHYATRLAPDEQGHFGLDLEYEYGKPIIPYTPGFRLIFPIDHQHQRHGYFVANIAVFKTIEYITSSPQHYAVDFIDQQGYYLLSTHKEKLFGGLIQAHQSYNLPQEKPALWQAIQHTPKKTGYFLTPEGLYVFKPFYTRLFESSGGLTLITLIPASRIQHIFQERDTGILHSTLQLFLLMGGLAVILALLWHHYSRIRLERAFNQVVLDNSIPIVLTDHHHQVLLANHQFSDLVHTEHHQITQYNVLQLYHARRLPKSTTQCLKKNRQWQGQIIIGDNTYKIRIKGLKGRHSKIQYYVYSFSDISEQYNAMVEFKQRSEKDPATGLNNKKRFDEALRHYAQLKQRYPDVPNSCLALVDIDDFKHVNDTHGHAVGDEVIVTIADTLSNRLRTTDFIARIGGDEFAIILQNIDIEQSYYLMQRVAAEIEQANHHKATISVGVTRITEDHKSTFNHADKALYQSKRKGKNNVSAEGFYPLTIVPDHQQSQS